MSRAQILLRKGRDRGGGNSAAYAASAVRVRQWNPRLAAQRILACTSAEALAVMRFGLAWSHESVICLGEARGPLRVE
jgi:hypothetical protein